MHDKLEKLLKTKNILIVEDEDNLREIISDSIESYLNEVSTAKNGIEGLELFKTLNNIDLIISDIHMNKMNGIKMCQEIRKYDPLIPIIFLTAYDTDENMFEAIKIKSKSILKKPFNKNQLLVSIMLALSLYAEEYEIINLSKNYTYNFNTKELLFDKEVISLTKKERLLLELLLKNQEHVVNFSLIENYVWIENGATADAIRMFINKLRKKIYPELIENIQGIGYKLTIK